MAPLSCIRGPDSNDTLAPSCRRRCTKVRSFVALLSLIVLSLLPHSCAAQQPTSDDCLACHSDKFLTTKRGGRTVSLFVDHKKFAASIHGSLQCTSCHADVEGKELPHSTPLAKVNCGSCHSDEAQQHGKMLERKAGAAGDALAAAWVNRHRK